MPDGQASVRRILSSVLQVTGPTTLVFVALILTGAVDFRAGLLAWALAIAGTAFILWRFLSGVLMLRRYVDATVAGEEAELPRFGPVVVARELSMAVRRLDRAWRARTRQIEASLDANRTIINSLPDPLILIGGDRSVIRANAAAQTVLGGDPTGRDLAASLRVPDVLTAADRAVEQDIGSTVAFALPPARKRHFAGRLQPLPRRASDGSRAVLVLHDVTDVRRNEQMRADFAANASHEIRTPLTALIGFIETLKTVPAEDVETRNRFLETMDEAARRIDRLVDDLLALSRIEMAERSAPLGRVDLAHVLETAARGVAWQADRAGTEISLDVAGDVGSVPGDEVELGQVFQNLLENAIKYGRERGHIRVTATMSIDEGGEESPADDAPAAAPAAVITVADDGPGIPADHIPRLTERFYRVDKARSRATGGTGLGLAIVKHIVNRHDGTLDIRSTLGEGTTVTIRLPDPERRRETTT